jgi:hypothetical protein
MELYRYSLTKKTKVKLNEPNYIIKFPKDYAGKKHEMKEVLYTTPYRSNYADDLNHRLSITYYPKYRLKVGDIPTLQLRNNVYEQIGKGLDTDDSGIPRTWPAFGKDGGVPEVLIIAPDHVTFEDPYLIRDGGAFERWYQDRVENLKLPLAIGNIISKSLSATEEFTAGERGQIEGYYPGLIRDGNPAVNSFYDNKYVTLSAAYEFIAGILNVRIWAAYWTENVDDRERRLWYEYTDPLEILPCSFDDCPDCISFCYHIYHEIHSDWKELESLLRKHYVRLLDDSNSYQYFQIFDVTTKLFSRIISMSHGFFASHSKRIFLP